MKKTLGGDRLGSGKKLKVELHGYERSTHDKGYVFRSTMSAGTLVPFIKELALPGDTFDIDLNVDVKTHPTVGPLFGSYKVQLDVFTAPFRLYQGQLHNNKLGIGLKMNTIKLPQVQLTAPNTATATDEIYEKLDIDNYQINPSCIFSYLGIRGVGTNRDADFGAKARDFCAIPWLAYWDIYKNYYANKQEEIGAVIHMGFETVPHDLADLEINGNSIDHLTVVNPPTILNANQPILLTDVAATQQNPEDILILINEQGSNELKWVPLLSIATLVNYSPPLATYYYNNSLNNPAVFAWAYTDEAPNPKLRVTQFDLDMIDDVREEILINTGLPFVLAAGTSLEPFKFALENHTTDFTLNPRAQSQEGLGLKTYQSDLLNNWLQTDWIDGTGGISEITSIDTSGGSFSIDTLNLSKKVYDMLNRIAVSGGSYDDWMDAVYTHDRYVRAETPVYHGGLIKELVFQEVVSQSESTDGQPLGTLAGKGTMAQKHKGGSVTIKVDEPCYIIGIVSITPRLDYSQGNDWDIHLNNMDDLHKPALDEIGFQELLTEQMAHWDTNWDSGTLKWITKSAGKQPAWINYMTNINKVRGNFAVKENEMFMVLNRRYQNELNGGTDDVEIKDLTTYIDPVLYNNIFADTAIDSQNFWVQIGINMEARRKMSAKLMPNL